MEWLVRAGGDTLYLSSDKYECPYGENHFGGIDIDSVTVSVDANKPLRSYLIELLKYRFPEVCGNNVDLDTRINLLYQNPADELKICVSPELKPGVLRKPYDFFVSADGKTNTRFTKKGQERFSLFYEGQRIKRERVRDIFGDVSELELTYFSSVGAEFEPKDEKGYIKDEHSIVELWSEHKDEKFKQELIHDLKKRVNTEALLTIDLPHLLGLRILAAVYDCEKISNSLDNVSLVDELSGDEYRCFCAYEDNRSLESFEADVNKSAGVLLRSGFLIKTDEWPYEEYHLPEGYVDQLEPTIIPKEQLHLPL